MAKHFDELLAERGMETPYPRVEPVYSDIDADIRRARDDLIDAEWSSEPNYKLIHNKRLFLQYLMGEKKRGLTRRIVGLQAVKEITTMDRDWETHP